MRTVFVAAVIAAVAALISSNAPAVADPSPCSHLSVGAAAKATGFPFTGATVMQKTRSDQDACAYHTAAELGPRMVIAVMPLAGPEIMGIEDEHQATMFKWKLTPVSGIADEAYAFNKQVDVRKGSVQYVFTIISRQTDAQTLVTEAKAAHATTF